MDCVCRKFAALKGKGITKEVQELLTKGAGVSVEIKDNKKINVVAAKKESQSR